MTSGSAPLSVNFTGLAGDSDGSFSLSWDFGDGSPPVTDTLSPSHTYTDPGTYDATLTVTDDRGAVTVSAVRTITVELIQHTTRRTRQHREEGRTSSPASSRGLVGGNHEHRIRGKHAPFRRTPTKGAAPRRLHIMLMAIVGAAALVMTACVPPDPGTTNLRPVAFASSDVAVRYGAA